MSRSGLTPEPSISLRINLIRDRSGTDFWPMRERSRIMLE